VEDLEKNFLQPKEKEKKSCGVQSRKEYHVKRALKEKFLHVNLLTLSLVLCPQACKILHF
jgi:hypothetical protein